MWEIFKRKTGKEFYRDSMEFFTYNPDDFVKDDPDDDYIMDDDEISYYIAYKKYN